MVEKRVYKIIATLGALFTYLFFVFLLVDFVKNSHTLIQDFGYNVDDAIVVDIAAPKKIKPLEKELKKPKPLPTPTPKPVIVPPKEVVKPEVIKEVKEVVKKPEKVVEQKEEESRDIKARSAKDLFSTVRTEKYDKVMQERRKEDAARASRLKKQRAKQRRERAERERKRKAKALAEAKAAMAALEQSVASSHKKSGQEDAFWSPVSNRIQALWQRTIQTQNGLSADVKITIDNRGRLSYRIKRLSNNALFNKKLKIFLQNLEYETFPRYRGGKSTSRTILFVDQEQ